MESISKTYRQAGIKGMGETNGGYSNVVTPSMKYKKAYNISPRINGETVAEWIQRCKK